MKKNNLKDIKILVIEDDQTMCEGIQTVLEKEGYQVVSAQDGLDGSRLFVEGNPHLVITDLRLPGKSGMHLLREFLERNPSIPVILISAYGTIDLAVSALKTGAKDFIAKPFSIHELKIKVAQSLQDITVSHLEEVDRISTFHGMVGSSSIMKNLYKKIKQVAQVDSAVLITGESGTGKELIARAIHEESKRCRKQFLAVNCGGFTDTLLESELFGHEKGAFTGAIRQHKGIFEQADRGTILLDEIGEISPQMQIKLLRVLQHQTFYRLGGTEEISTDVRIIASTNRDLRDAIENKQFREDLFFRLNVIPIDVPPLRERYNDIPDLVEYIITTKSVQLNRKAPIFQSEAIKKLMQYSWPGNIRELENFLERIFIFSHKNRITADDIYLDDGNSIQDEKTGKLTSILKNKEYQMIKDALEKSDGIKQKAAKILGIKTSTLYYKMNKYGLLDKKNKLDHER